MKIKSIKTKLTNGRGLYRTLDYEGKENCFVYFLFYFPCFYVDFSWTYYVTQNNVTL